MHKLPVAYSMLNAKTRKQVRERYEVLQKHRCYHCKALLNGDPAPEVAKIDVNPRLFPQGFFAHPVHLHHSHKTGLTIGAIHAHCNAVLWQHKGE